jgi:predicted CoA-substrate-specific enzyme activase
MGSEQMLSEEMAHGMASHGPMAYRMGIDVGSVTAKVVVLDRQQRMVFSAYRRHRAETWATIYAILQDAFAALGDVPASLMITGSAGMGVCERYGIPFIQEVIAAAEVVKRLYPQVRTLIDIGGEDAKLIYFGHDGLPDIRMNGSCAGGTGAYIDEMATLLNVPVTQLSALAEQHTRIHPIASRCGVFGKTDVQNLLSRDVDRPDIAASILHAVVLQTQTTLARGIELEPLLLFCGGPLTFIPALRTAFIQGLGMRPEQVLDAPHLELVPATGAALAQTKARSVSPLVELLELLSVQRAHQRNGSHHLVPLFVDEADQRQWEEARAQHNVERIALEQIEGKPCFLGIDSGSTTTKIVLVDCLGRVAFSHYAHNNGNAIQATREGLEGLRQVIDACEQPPHIARSAATGYGEDLIRAAFGLDDGIVETVAHFRGAKAFDPDVSFILDIGGQDMKAIFVRDGQITNVEINEACSSGCGTFIETFARSMGHGVADFAHKACSSSAPCDLGTRCTVFMNSRIKQALREDAKIGDISAGLAYSVIKNALYKVLRLSDTSVLGDHIVVQGGTFRNPAVQRALESLLGRPVVCPDMAELMGAYGAALTARDSWQDDLGTPSRFVGLEDVESVTNYDRRLIQCRGCENRCAVTKLIFSRGDVFYTGNRCERIFTNQGEQFTRGTTLTDRKLELLFDRPIEPASEANLTIGIPRVLNMYEEFPFWNTLLVECGFKIELSDPSSSGLYRKGVGTVMSENICFPAKLVHGHIVNLVEKQVDRICFPMVFSARNEFTNVVNSYNCPIVTGYPDVVDSAIDPSKQHDIPLDTLPVTFHDQRLLREACYRYLRNLGVGRRAFQRAFTRALAAQQAYKEAVRAAGAEILTKARQEGRLVVLLIGRPYHLDPLIHHGVPQILVDLGVDVITEDAVPLEGKPTLDNLQVPTQWAFVNRFYHAARWAGSQEDVEVVQFNSFGCGPDAFSLDEVRRVLESMGKNYTILRIDEIDSTGSSRLRLRSLIETIRANRGKRRNGRSRRHLKLFEASDRYKTVLVPNFSQFCAPIIAGPLLQMGYNVETLPPPDQESVQLGLKYAQNEICYPGLVVIGDLIKALQSGKYDLADVAVGSWQTGGQCRATSVLSMLRAAMIQAGFKDVPIVALTPDRNLHDQPGYDLSLRKYLPKALLACVYMDAISSMYYATAIREVNRGQAEALGDELAEPLLRGATSLERQAVMLGLEEAVTRFNAIPTREHSYPKVGIVGEIWVKYNAFANNHVARWLMEQGVEVIVPDFLTYFLGWFVSADVRVQEKLKRRDFAWLLYRLLEGPTQRILDQAERIKAGFKYHMPGHTIREIAHAAEGSVALTHAYGESWLIAGEIGTLVENGVSNVLCLQPFGCIANQVVARGVAKRIKQRHPGLNLLFLDLDAGVSEVNYFNRMHFFVSQAKEMAERI